MHVLKQELWSTELVIFTYLNDSTTFAALCKRKEFFWQPDGFTYYVTEDTITWKCELTWQGSALSSAIDTDKRCACISGLLFVI
jgi:hypothetical protein